MPIPSCALLRQGSLPAAALVAALALAAGGRCACAQSPESDLSPDTVQAPLPDSAFVVPDASDRVLESTKVEPEHKKYSLKWGVALLPADYTNFTQDPTSQQQVGRQEDKFEVRSARLMARGYVDLGRTWNYMISYEYKGFDQASTTNWAATDLNISTQTGTILGKVTLGKMKEPYVYEMAGDAANLPQNERILSPFFKSRSIGIQFSNTFMDRSGTWSAGWYNDWLASGKSFATNGQDAAGRVTFLPVWQDEGAGYLHLGASVRYAGAADHVVRLRGKPASNVASNYVDTGNIRGDHAVNLGLEALWNSGPYSVLAEYAHSQVSSADGSNPGFSGYYATASWVVTGEHRPYDRNVGYARRVMPSRDIGAWEVFMRYGVVDLNDGAVRGGRMTGWWTGINWWATRRWKASIGYGTIDLDRGGTVGNTQTVLSRLQWIF